MSFSTKHSAFCPHAINDQVIEGIVILYMVMFTTHKILDNVVKTGQISLEKVKISQQVKAIQDLDPTACAKVVS